jgi:hypothetical protein
MVTVTAPSSSDDDDHGFTAVTAELVTVTSSSTHKSDEIGCDGHPTSSDDDHDRHGHRPCQGLRVSRTTTRLSIPQKTLRVRVVGPGVGGGGVVIGYLDCG